MEVEIDVWFAVVMVLIVWWAVCVLWTLRDIRQELWEIGREQDRKGLGTRKSRATPSVE